MVRDDTRAFSAAVVKPYKQYTETRLKKEITNRIRKQDSRKKERNDKQSFRQTQTRDGGEGQGPHLHEQDFGRTIRGTGGALLLLTRDTTSRV